MLYVTGSHVIESRAISNLDNRRIYAYTSGGGTSFSIVNVSVKEVISATNTPRLDYSTGAEAFLLEPQSTNLITQSELFSDASWRKSNTIVSDNSTISVDGTQNATLIQSTTTTSCFVAPNNLTLTIGNTYTFSCFAKKGNNDWIRLAHVTSGGTGCWFDLENGVVGTVNSQSATIEYYGNGWYRCTNTFIAIDDTNSDNAFIGICDANGSTNAGIVGKNDYLWGAQLEAGSYLTSYIPTQGSAVTRQADTASGAGNSEVFNDSEGVLFADVISNGGTTDWYISIYDLTKNNIVAIRIVYNNSNKVSVFMVSNGGSAEFDVFYDVGSLGFKNFNKFALKYKVNDVSLFFNGFEVITISSAAMASGFKSLNFANATGGTQPFYGKTKEIAYYDTVLTDLELETLTSYRSWLSMVKELNLNVIYNG